METKEIYITNNKQYKIASAHIVVKKPSERQMKRSIINAIKETEEAKAIIDLMTRSYLTTKK